MFLTDCVPLWCSPTGPGIPFGTWYLAVFDLLRVACVVAALWLLSHIGREYWRALHGGGQRDKYIALGVFAFIVISNEISDLGNIASYRLVLSIIAVVYALRGLRRSKHEEPAQPSGLL